jgi:hypothetical protein
MVRPQGFAWTAFFPVGLVLAACLAGLSGCAGFVDEVTSRDFDFKTMFTRPSPLVVLQKSTDGNQRAKALACLKEPLQNGGNQKDQDVIVLILTTAATSDRQPLCRLAAVKALGHFKDPRAVDTLKKVYYDDKPFAPEQNTIINQQALVALGLTGSPEARDLLVRVVREPPPAQDSSEIEKQQAMDCRLAAVRALGNYNHYEVAQTLVKVLETEKDVAVRDRAHESLVSVTGKHLPPDAKQWEDLLNQPGYQPTPESGPSKALHVLVGWWQ